MDDPRQTWTGIKAGVVDFRRYYRGFWAVFIAECYHSWRVELFSTVAIAGISFVITHNTDTRALHTWLSALEACGIWLLILAAYHLVKIPWLLDRDSKKQIADKDCIFSKMVQEKNATIAARDAEIAAKSADIARLTWSDDRPKLSFTKWAEEIEKGKRIRAGFHVKNDGGAALEVDVERFMISPPSDAEEAGVVVTGATIPRVEREGEGFIPVWMEGEPESIRWNLDLGLRQVAERTFKEEELKHWRPLVFPVCLTYRDFNNLWYRSVGALLYTQTQSWIGRIEFTSVQQTCLGLTRPEPLALGIPDCQS